MHEGTIRVGQVRPPGSRKEVARGIDVSALHEQLNGGLVNNAASGVEAQRKLTRVLAVRKPGQCIRVGAPKPRKRGMLVPVAVRHQHMQPYS